MEIFFSTIETKLEKTTPSALIAYLTTQEIKEFHETLLFQGETDFWQNLDYLESDITLNSTEMKQLQKEQDFRIIAMTIDGDFLAGTLEKTFVIPKNLIQADVEQYSQPILKFLSAYENGQIHSEILAAL